MAPSKTNPKRNAQNVLQPIRRSNRIAARFAVTNLNAARGHHKKSPTKRTNETSQILMLNDDCLLTIFSFLSLVDLFVLRKSCRRFRALADVEASNQGRREQFHYIYKYKSHEDVVDCYGQFMQNVVFERSTEVMRLAGNDTRAPNSIWKWLRRCTALKNLTIRKMSLVYDRHSAHIYNGLVKLQLDNCQGTTSNHDNLLQYKQLFRACKNLKTISVNHFFWPFLIDCAATSKSIEKISIRECYFYWNDLIVRRLNNKLKNLKCLEFDFRYDCYYMSDWLSMNIIYASEIDTLEHLILTVRSIPVGMATGLDQLKNIKLCELHYYCNRYTVFDENEFSDAMNTFDVTINSKIGYRCIEYDIKLQRKN